MSCRCRRAGGRARAERPTVEAVSPPPFDPADPPVPELEVDEDVPPRPEEEVADAGRG